ncbi:hypothetical protein AX15_004306 [Amanita polypyramis BW_CC]|nr:hypothetical protein AX15_004306 [Amanita polypyramis BW_CC]
MHTPAMAISVSTAELIGTFLETLGYGVYLTVGPQAFLALRRKQLDRGHTIYLYLTMIITFILVTSHFIIDLIRAFVAFTAHTDIPYAPELYYADLSSTLCIAKSSTVAATTLVADILLIYRTLIVWGRKWWILILPAILYILDVGASIWFVRSLQQTKNISVVVETAAFARSRFFFASTLAVNLLCTCLIAYKIWTIQNKMTKYTGFDNRVRNVFSIILESAAIYTADLACMIILVAVRSGALFIFLNSMAPLIGLVFTFIVLRTSSNINHYSSDKGGLEMRSGTSPYVVNNEMINMRPTDSSSEGVRIHFEKVVHHDTEHERDSV